MKKSEALPQLDRMLEKKFVATPPTKDELTLALLEQIPLLRGLLRNLNTATLAVGRLIEASSSIVTSFRKSSQGIQTAGLVLDIINFVRIPFIYLFAYLMGKRPPLTLSKTAQWLYAAVLLGLTIAVVAIPPLGPILAITTSSVILFADLFLFAKLFYKKSKIKKELEDSEVSVNAGEMEELRSEIELLKFKLEKDVSLSLDEQYVSVYSDLVSRFDTLSKIYQTNLDNQLKNELILNKMDRMHHVEKTFAVALSTLALIGAVLALSFPPLGLWLMAGAAIAGGTFAIGRLVVSLYKIYKESKEKEALENESEPELEIGSLPESMKSLLKTSKSFQAEEELDENHDNDYKEPLSPNTPPRAEENRDSRPLQSDINKLQSK